MHDVSRKSVAAVGVALALGLGVAGASRAHDGHDHGTGPHGGALGMTKRYHFEVVFTAAGFKVFPYGMDGKPLDATKLSGKATFYHPSTPKPWFDRPFTAAAAGPGQAPVSLDCTINLSKVPTKSAKVSFEVSGLPDPAEPSAAFTVPFALTQAPPVAAVRPAPATITFARATQADQPAINAQRVCKVSGEPLGSMGVPVKVTRGDSSVFLCCQGCLKKVQANPVQYLGKAG